MRDMWLRDNRQSAAQQARRLAERHPAVRALAFASLLVVAAVASRAQGLPSSSAATLAGVSDVHAHAGPDSVERPLDALALARLARDNGMRAIVIKNHNEPTAALAYAVRQSVPGIEVFGAIALNRAVGGVNPLAVRQMAGMTGGSGKVVWLPTWDAENQVRFDKADQPFVSIARNGQLLPETREVLRIIAARRLVLATGHSSPAESLLVIREARALGVEHIVVTHPLSPTIGMSTDEMRQAAAQGAFIELVYGAVADTPPQFPFEDYVNVVRAIGPEHVIMSSDSGNSTRPLHTDALRIFRMRMRSAGISDAALDLMMKTNPARLLGLP